MSRWEPPYYSRFSCRKGSCRHSCCRDWEIDIDAEALARYEKLPGVWGETVRSRIVQEGGTAHFALDAQGRCPFLTREGLCRMILCSGEEMLCGICREHPRFYHVFGDHTEAGLGLCCEEAAFLCLTWPEPFSWKICGDTEGEMDPQEQAVLSFREDCIRIVKDRTIPAGQRVRKLKSRFAVRTPGKEEAIGFFRSLERLEEAWDRMLDLWGSGKTGEGILLLPEAELALEQWMVYLLCRHLPDAVQDGNVQGHLGLCVLLWETAEQLFAAIKEKNGQLSVLDMAETVRLISAEIEYSQENTDAVLLRCSQEA